MGCRISLTNRSLEYGDIFFGDGSLNGFILNGVETIYEIPKQIYLHGKEIVQTTTSLEDGLCKSKSSMKIWSPVMGVWVRVPFELLKNNKGERITD